MSVVSHTNAAGDVSIGVEIDGVFVPFAARSAAKVAQMVQRGHDLQDRAEQGDALAQDVLGSAFTQPTTKKGAS